MSQTPTFPEALRLAFDSRLEAMHVAIPGRVETYDATKTRANIQPLIRRRFDDRNGVTQIEDLPVVPDVPIVFPGAGIYRITFPISPGDTVLLVFSEASIDKWLSGGGLVDPNDNRRNALSDAIAIPGLRSFGDSSPAGEDALAIEADEIRLGSHDASDPVALKSELDDLKSIIASWIPVANDGGSSLKAEFASWSTPGATKVKAE